MKLTKEDESFLKTNKYNLESLFLRWIEDLKNKAFDIQGKTDDEIKYRENMIGTIKLFQQFISDIEIISQKKEEQEENKNFI